MQGLHDPHRGPTCPVEPAGSGEFESNGEIADFDRPNACVGVDDNVGGNGVGKT